MFWKNRFTLVTLVACTCVPFTGIPSAFAQQSTDAKKSVQTNKDQSATDLPTAETLMQRHITAIGGREALQKLKSIEFTGKLVNDVAGHNFEAQLTTLAVAPDKYRLLLQHPQFSMIRVASGNRAWGWRSGGEAGDEGETDWLSDGEANRFINRAVFNPELNPDKLFKSMKTIAKTTIGEQQSYEVACQTLNEAKLSRFFDADSGRLIKVIQTIKSSTFGDYQQETLVKDYQQHAGVWLPMRLEHTLFIGDIPGTQLHIFNNVTVNGDVSDKLFEVPPELSASDSADKEQKPASPKSGTHGPHPHGSPHSPINDENKSDG